MTMKKCKYAVLNTTYAYVIQYEMMILLFLNEISMINIC